MKLKEQGYALGSGRTEDAQGARLLLNILYKTESSRECLADSRRRLQRSLWHPRRGIIHTFRRNYGERRASPALSSNYPRADTLRADKRGTRLRKTSVGVWDRYGVRPAGLQC